MADHPRAFSGARLKESLQALGRQLAALEVRCVDYGDATARTRGVV